MFGGTSVPFGETSSNCVSVCNLSSLKWQNLDTEGDLPIPSYGGVRGLGFNGLVYAMELPK